MADFNARIIDEFRTNDGHVSGPFAGSTLLLLTTRGAKSGRDIVSPVMTTEDYLRARDAKKGDPLGS